MCLSKPKRVSTNAPIACWKVVKKYYEYEKVGGPDSTGGVIEIPHLSAYMSPCENFEYHLGEKYKIDPKTELDEVYPEQDREVQYHNLAHSKSLPEAIEGLAFHTFKYVADAIQYAKNCATLSRPLTPREKREMKFAVLECKIPAEADYIFRGELFNFLYGTKSFKCYASSELETVKEVYELDWPR